MIAEHYPEFASVEVSRTVSGARRAMTWAREVGRLVLGDDIDNATSITRLGVSARRSMIEYEDDPDLTPIYKVTPIADQYFQATTTADNLAMVVWRAEVPPDLSKRMGIGRAVSWLAAETNVVRMQLSDVEGTKRRARVRLPGLATTLNEICGRYGFDPEATPISCSVDMVATTRDSNIVGFVPEAGTKGEELLQRQTEAVVERLRLDGSPLAEVSPVYSGSAPFAMFPRSTRKAESDRLLDELHDCPPVRLTMGPPVVSGAIKAAVTGRSAR